MRVIVFIDTGEEFAQIVETENRAANIADAVLTRGYLLKTATRSDWYPTHRILMVRIER